jgi:hypothetical protein
VKSRFGFDTEEIFPMRLHAFSALALMLPLALYACGGDDDDDTGNDGGTSGAGGTTSKGGSGGKAGTAGKGGSAGNGSGGAPQAGSGGSEDGGMAGEAGAGGSAGASGESGAGGDAGMSGAATTAFRVRIENVSGSTPSPTPISPGVWLLSSEEDPLFSAGEADRGKGLERIAEDGSPATLAPTLAADENISATGVFNTPVGASAAGPALPGQAFEFLVEATPEDGRLSFASMFGQSNDAFVAPNGKGIALFDEDGRPLGARDVSAAVSLWDAGTEQNQAPGMGPVQAPRQAMANTGAREGVIARFTDATRALPIPSAIVDVTVTEDDGTFSVTLANVSGMRHAIDTPISPVFFATHAASWSLFSAGMQAPAGLEALAEDGSPAGLVAANTGADGIGQLGAMTIPVGAVAAGPALSGDSFTFMVTPDAAHPYLSFASMVGTTNDAFLALPAGGVALLNGSGAPHSAAKVAADIRHMLAVWDAGTEANEVPGVGPNQAPRQPAANTGPADPDNMVRLYADATNDLAGVSLGGFASVSIEHTTGNEFAVTVTNTSSGTAYPGRVAPLAWALHDAATRIFSLEMPASAGLERLAEDGNPALFESELAALSGVGSSAVVNVPVGAASPAPLDPGQSFRFTVMADTTHRFLSLAQMIAPSNDAFLAFDPGGIALLDDAGAVRSDQDISSDIAAHLYAWDAGTEANQSGAAGPEQIGRQAAPNTGANEGGGTVRNVDGSVWPFPAGHEIVKVTITPVE